MTYRARMTIHRLTSAFAALALACLTAAPALAQNPFSPAAKVGDRVITQFELDQRARMLELLNAPGDPLELAQEQLIEDKLKAAAAQRFGVGLTEEELLAGQEEFAARANLSAEEFIAALEGAGVAEQTFIDFVASGVVWRKVVRGRFGSQIVISDQDIDRALTTAGNGESVRVLISEIFIAAPPQQAQQARDLANQISRVSTFEGFAAAARQYSAAPTGRQGGRVNWMPVADLPPNLRGVILELKPGEVTRPLPVEGAIALFQLRAIEEGEYTPHTVTGLDYAAYYLPGGRSEATLAEAAKIRARVDTCDDLYGEAKGQPEEALERGLKAPGEIPQDVAYELAKLDAGEVSTALTRSNGETLVFLMLCERQTEFAQELDRAAVRTQLQNQQIDRFAQQYLEQLRSESRIVIY
ncbi:MAG: peptidylprolyl isomerase [Pseudooceanicola sp.]